MSNVCQEHGRLACRICKARAERRESSSAGSACSIARFPVQGGDSIPMWLAEEVYARYVKKWGNYQSLERLGERGGFAKGEILELLAQ